MHRIAIQTAIVLFCLWHMFAVAAFTVPRVAKDSFAVFSQTFLIPKVAPYLQLTSQWQLWDLFAPDPLRRITSYVVESKNGDEWKTLEVLETGTYPWWEHSTRFKYFINVLDANNQGRDAAKRRFLALQCQKFALSDTHIRLSYRNWIIPHLTKIPASGFWQNWAPNVEEVIGLEIICPSSAQ